MKCQDNKPANTAIRPGRLVLANLGLDRRIFRALSARAVCLQSHLFVTANKTSEFRSSIFVGKISFECYTLKIM